MSEPSFELLKYWFRLNFLQVTLLGDGLVQVVGNGTGKDVPTEVVGGNLGLY